MNADPIGRDGTTEASKAYSLEAYSIELLKRALPKLAVFEDAALSAIPQNNTMPATSQGTTRPGASGGLWVSSPQAPEASSSEQLDFPIESGFRAQIAQYSSWIKINDLPEVSSVVEKQAAEVARYQRGLITRRQWLDAYSGVQYDETKPEYGVPEMRPDKVCVMTRRSAPS